MDKNILNSWRPHDTNYKKANKSKADVSITVHFTGIPAFIRSSPQTIKKCQQNKIPPKQKKSKKPKPKNQQVKTGGQNTAFSHEPNYKKAAILSG